MRMAMRMAMVMAMRVAMRCFYPFAVLSQSVSLSVSLSLSVALLVPSSPTYTTPHLPSPCCLTYNVSYSLVSIAAFPVFSPGRPARTHFSFFISLVVSTLPLFFALLAASPHLPRGSVLSLTACNLSSLVAALPGTLQRVHSFILAMTRA